MPQDPVKMSQREMDSCSNISAAFFDHSGENLEPELFSDFAALLAKKDALWDEFNCLVMAERKRAFEAMEKRAAEVERLVGTHTEDVLKFAKDLANNPEANGVFLDLVQQLSKSK